MEYPSRESLLKKVIVRFRSKAGKNGQVFPQRSWMSGLMIISSQRIILASGPFHHIIPYDDLLSIEDEGTFPLPREGKVQIMPLVHSNGMDAYLTMVGVTGSVMRSITRDLYEQICNHYRGCRMDVGGESIPVKLHGKDPGIEVRPANGSARLIPIDAIREGSMSKNGQDWVISAEGGEELKLITHPVLGRWLKLFMEHYIGAENAQVEERYLKVLRYLCEHPSTTISMTSNLSLVALEASTILNEMVFLGWVAMDHASKLYQLTGTGRDVLERTRKG